MHYLSQFDVIGLAETFCYEPINLDGFNTVAFKPAKKEINVHFSRKLRGRGSGGLTIVARKGIVVEPVRDINEEVMLACRIKNWTICVCYVPPQTSKYEIKNWNVGIEENIFALIARYGKKIIVCGDLNCRIGEKNELTNGMYDDNNVFPPTLYDLKDTTGSIGGRASKDKTINSYGEKLVSICKSVNFFVLNGRGENDVEGEFTFVGHQGCSVIDLGLTHVENEDLVSFEVGEQIFSSHMPIHMNVRVECAVSVPVFTGEKIPVYRFNEKLRELINGNLTVSEPMLNDLIEQANYGFVEPDTCLKNLYAILKKVLAPLKLRGGQKNRHRKSLKPMLSGKACEALNYLRKIRRRHKITDKTRMKYLLLRSIYKKERKEVKAIRKKESEEELIDLYKRRDSAGLWKRMSSAKGKGTSGVDKIDPKNGQTTLVNFIT